jgi:hypothetical protein
MGNHLMEQELYGCGISSDQPQNSPSDQPVDAKSVRSTIRTLANVDSLRA